MNYSQQLEPSLGKRTELICTPNNFVYYVNLISISLNIVAEPISRIVIKILQNLSLLLYENYDFHFYFLYEKPFL